MEPLIIEVYNQANTNTMTQPTSVCPLARNMFITVFLMFRQQINEM